MYAVRIYIKISSLDVKASHKKQRLFNIPSYCIIKPGTIKQNVWRKYKQKVQTCTGKQNTMFNKWVNFFEWRWYFTKLWYELTICMHVRYMYLKEGTCTRFGDAVFFKHHLNRVVLVLVVVTGNSFFRQSLFF